MGALYRRRRRSLTSLFASSAVAASAVAASLLVASLLVAGCGGSNHQYISNGTENLFFRVPKDWTIFRLSQTDGDGRVPAQPSGADRTWHVLADASPAATADNARQDAMPDAPVAVAEVWKFDFSHNEQMSQTRMRSTLFGGFDPLLQDPGLPAEWEVVSAAAVNFGKGVLGYRVVINQPTPEDPTVFRTISGTSAFDATSSTMYLLKVLCKSECYKANQAAIDDVATSWTVNRK